MISKIGKGFPTSGKCETTDVNFMILLSNTGRKSTTGSILTSETTGIAWNTSSYWWVRNFNISSKPKYHLDELIETNDVMGECINVDDVEFECTNTNGYGGNEYQIGCKQDCYDCDFYQPIDLGGDDIEADDVFSFVNNGMLEVYIPKIEKIEKIKKSVNIKLYKNEIIKI